MTEFCSDRRALFARTLAMLAMAPIAMDADAGQTREIGVYGFEVPPKSTLCGAIVFLGEDLVEKTLASSRKSKSERGRFDGKRLVEFSWINSTADVERVNLSAKALTADRELPWGSVKFAAEQHLFIAFGQRAMPVELSHRHGGYPHEAVFVGFVVLN
jgi:hypothetical protein